MLASYSHRHGVEPILPGINFSPRQLFWISNARTWCETQRPGALKKQVRLLDRCGQMCNDDYVDLIGVFSSWAIQIYNLVTQEYKNSILDIIDRPQWWKTTIIFCKCYVLVLYSLCFCLSRKVIISLYFR